MVAQLSLHHFAWSRLGDAALSLGLPGLQEPHLRDTLVAGTGEKRKEERRGRTRMLCLPLLVSLMRRVLESLTCLAGDWGVMEGREMG